MREREESQTSWRERAGRGSCWSRSSNFDSRSSWLTENWAFSWNATTKRDSYLKNKQHHVTENTAQHLLTQSPTHIQDNLACSSLTLCIEMNNTSGTQFPISDTLSMISLYIYAYCYPKNRIGLTE